MDVIIDEEGLRIELMETDQDATFFDKSSSDLKPALREILVMVGSTLAGIPGDVVVEGHTDSLPYASGKNMNNWLLSSARAEATRKELVDQGVMNSRVTRIEGVADTEPYNPEDRMDDRNRRISITLKRN